jgi:hypothetical protein
MANRQGRVAATLAVWLTTWNRCPLEPQGHLHRDQENPEDQHRSPPLEERASARIEPRARLQLSPVRSLDHSGNGIGSEPGHLSKKAPPPHKAGPPRSKREPLSKTRDRQPIRFALTALRPCWTNCSDLVKWRTDRTEGPANAPKPLPRPSDDAR